MQKSEARTMTKPTSETGDGPATTRPFFLSFSGRYLLLLDLFLLAALILATRLATFLHEVIGHGLFAAAFRGEVSGIRVSLFGGGHTYYHFNAELGLTESFLVAFGGILINLLSGMLTFRWTGNPRIGSSWAIFSGLFSLVSLLGALTYACLGFYYDVGDPVGWIKGPPPRGEWLWVPFLLASPFAAYIAVRSFFILIQPWFPAKGFSGRACILVLTLGVAGASYAGLYGLTGQRSMALDTPLLAYERAKEEVQTKKRLELYRSARETHPEWSESDVEQWVERTPIEVRAGEVPKRFPLIPVLLLCHTAGALMALRNVGKAVSLPPPQISPRSALLALCLAGSVLGVLALTGGWVWMRG